MLIFCLTQKFEWQIDPTVNSKIKNLGLDHVHVNWSCEFIMDQMWILGKTNGLENPDEY